MPAYLVNKDTNIDHFINALELSSSLSTEMKKLILTTAKNNDFATSRGLLYSQFGNDPNCMNINHNIFVGGDTHLTTMTHQNHCPLYERPTTLDTIKYLLAQPGKEAIDFLHHYDEKARNYSSYYNKFRSQSTSIQALELLGAGLGFYMLYNNYSPKNIPPNSHRIKPSRLVAAPKPRSAPNHAPSLSVRAPVREKEIADITLPSSQTSAANIIPDLKNEDEDEIRASLLLQKVITINRKFKNDDSTATFTYNELMNDLAIIQEYIGFIIDTGEENAANLMEIREEKVLSILIEAEETAKKILVMAMHEAVRTRDFQAAHETYNEIRARGLDSAELYADYILLAERIRNFAAGQSAFNEARIRNLINADIYANYLRLLRLLDDHEEAFAIAQDFYVEARREELVNANLYAYYIITMRIVGHIDEARRAYDEAKRRVRDQVFLSFYSFFLQK